MVEKKEEDNQQEEIKEPDSENIENEEDNNAVSYTHLTLPTSG